MTAAIVVGTNERPWLPECLETLRRSGGPLVIYVDNVLPMGAPATSANGSPTSW